MAVIQNVSVGSFKTAGTNIKILTISRAITFIYMLLICCLFLLLFLSIFLYFMQSEKDLRFRTLAYAFFMKAVSLSLSEVCFRLIVIVKREVSRRVWLPFFVKSLFLARLGE